MALNVLVTDSGLGGLSICAGIEASLRTRGTPDPVHLTYFNAWPEEGVGYNSMPEVATRLAYVDRALDRMATERPDRIVIACNTLSILYAQSAFARAARVPVLGIIEAGVDVFMRELGAAPDSRIALFGTRITIESGVHRDALVARGIAPAGIAAAGCHGLAGAIERDIADPEVDRLIEDGVSRIAFDAAARGLTYAGLCCTHFGYVADRFRLALESRLGTPVTLLDPNRALVDRVTADVATGGSSHASTAPTVSVISKVRLDDKSRNGISQLIAGVSPATVAALGSYRHVPDLF